MTNNLVVAVFDASTESAFELEVGDAPPLDVFNHPYAYAARSSVDYGPMLEMATEQPAAV